MTYNSYNVIDRICETCTQPFKARPDQIKIGHGRFCSHRCYALSRTYDDLATRLWQKVDKTAGNDSCWMYTGYRNPDGYGVIGCTGKATRSTHRVAYELAYGNIPEGMQVLHRCDNPACCNPAHLFLGTQADNVADMVRKNRLVVPSGEKSRFAKLTLAQVEEIRAQSTGKRGEIVALARKYEVSTQAISDILHREAWK